MLDDEIDKELSDAVERSHRLKSDIIREALKQYLPTVRPLR
jgi:predicted transcriptional regulator